MPERDIIVIGASAGGVTALQEIAAGLPAGFPAAIFVVLHVSPDSMSALPTILGRAGPLPALHPRDFQPIRHGHIYVAPPDHHLMVEDGHVRVVRGPRENRSRPAIDPLFRSAALARDSRVIGVILTGALNDGTTGRLVVKRRGGIAIVQDPDDAQHSGMPASALANVEVDYCLPLGEIGPALVRLVMEPADEERNTAVTMDDRDSVAEFENRIDQLESDALEGDDRPGEPSVYGCPECGGVLWKMKEGQFEYYRCRVGHSYTADHLLLAQSENLENALWSALRALEEKASLSRRLADRATKKRHHAIADRFTEQAQTAEEHAKTIRDILLAADPKAVEEARRAGERVAAARQVVGET